MKVENVANVIVALIDLISDGSKAEISSMERFYLCAHSETSSHCENFEL